MIRRLTLAVGFSAGYVLGAKAGKERYAQIESKVRELLGQPAVQDFTSNVANTASAAADKAKTTVNEKVEAVADKVDAAAPSRSTTSPTPIADDIVVVDLGPGTSGTSTTAPTTARPLPTGPATSAPTTARPLPTGPIGGASPSGSAPDVV